MSKRYIKGNLRRGDYLRALLTDTSPYEVPLIVSNDGFYKNLCGRSKVSPVLKELIDRFVTSNEQHYTIPYRFKIEKDSISTRQLSLLHPTAQHGICEFYARYDTLITYYCSQSEFCIRRPLKVGSSFFFRSPLSELNKYKNNQIDTRDLDKFVRNPASFFSYRGFVRLYKFFLSSDYMRLEKKYPYMELMDVSKCFSSIYTHSVSWAIKGAQHSKDNSRAQSFGNDFDRLMHKMNFNETNGICIGPETSRIFAEIIFNSIDISILQLARQTGFVHGRDYDCRRYVDDIILFSRSPQVSITIQKIISDRLGVFNLHLNEGKSESYERPFVTPKSYIISSVKQRLTSFFDGIIEKTSDGTLLVPRRIYKPDAVVRSLILSIKSACYEEGVGYDMVSNYVVSSLVKRIERLVVDYTGASSKENRREFYGPVLMRLLESTFFFYTVQPTVASSYHVSRAIIVLWRFLKEHIPEETLSASGQIQGWVEQLIKQHSKQEDFLHRQKIPIEFLNVILAAGEIDQTQMIDQTLLRDFVFDKAREDYFSLVSCLFYIKDRSPYSNLRKETEDCIVRVLGDCKSACRNAHDAHLLLDSICCPYLSMATRITLLRYLRAVVSLPSRSRTELEEDVSEMEQHPWFVQWEKLDILNMVRKKELSSVY